MFIKYAFGLDCEEKTQDEMSRRIRSYSNTSK